MPNRDPSTYACTENHGKDSGDEGENSDRSDGKCGKINGQDPHIERNALICRSPTAWDEPGTNHEDTISGDPVNERTGKAELENAARNEKERKNGGNAQNKMADISAGEPTQGWRFVKNRVTPEREGDDNRLRNGGKENKAYKDDDNDDVIVEENVSKLEKAKALSKKAFSVAKVPFSFIQDKLHMNAHIREKTAGAAALNGALMVRSIKYLITVVPNDQDTLVLFSLHSTLLGVQMFTFVLFACVGFVNLEDASNRTKKFVFIINHVTSLFIVVITILEMAITSLQPAHAQCPQKP